MHILTVEQFRRAVPLCRSPEGWVAPLNDAMLMHGISDDRDYMVEFLAQCAHESASFNRLEEDLRYSAERLMVVWPKRFPNLTIASKYAGNPYELAEFVYGGRLGNVRPGDGWKYRGRGIPMVTGLGNYKLVSKRMNDPEIMLCPDRLQTKKIAAMAGATWWAANPALNQLADDRLDDDDFADFVSITRIVNGGTHGLKSRESFRDAFKDALL